MKKLLATAVMVLVLTFGAGAQLPRYWNQGPLTWNDLNQVAANPDSLYGSWLEYSFDVEFVDTCIDGVTTCRTLLRTFVDKSKSWVLSDHVNANELRFNQVIFNLAELQCRMFQSTIEHNLDVTKYDSLLTMVDEYCQADQEAFGIASQGGADTAVVQRWLDSTNQLLQEIPGLEAPKFADVKDWGVGAHLGMGTTLHGAGVNDILKNPINFGFGFEGIYGRSSFMMNIVIGSRKAKSSYAIDGESFSTNDFATWLQVYWGYGYYALRTNRFNIMPMIGLGFNGVSATHSLYATGDDEDAPSWSTVCGAWLAGCAFDWKFSSTVTCADNYGLRDMEDVSLRLLLYASRERLDIVNMNVTSPDYLRSDYNTIAINFMLAFNFGVRTIRMK